MAKKSQDRSSTAPATSAAGHKPKYGGKDNQAVDPVDQSRQPPDFRPQRKNLPMLILSIVLLTAWLIFMLVIAVNR